AATAVWRELRRRWPKARRLTVLCGSGKNAGDGYLVALLAQGAGWDVRVLALPAQRGLEGDAAAARRLAVEAGVAVHNWPAALPAEGIVLDALLGTGLRSEVREPMRSAIGAINHSGLPVLAVD